MPVFAAALLVGIGGLAIPFLMADKRPAVDASPARLAIGILPVRAVTPGGDLNWLAAGLEGQLPVELGEVSGLEVRPNETIAALTARGWPLDSVALASDVDYLVKMQISKAPSDSILVTLDLIEGGIRSVRVGNVRAPLREPTSVEGLGRLLAERLRPMLGSRLRERELESRSTNPLAAQLRRRAEHHRLLARTRLGENDLQSAGRALDSATRLLVESERRDPNWPAPRLARASLSQLRALFLLRGSRGTDTAGVRQVFNAGVVLLDSVLAANPRDQTALALRGRLRWQRTQLAERNPVVVERAADTARRDLEEALAIDATLARAAADLSQIHYSQGRYGDAAVYAERADSIDSYMEEASDIINRLALSNLEINRDAEAMRWCREGLRRFPANPAHHGCVLDVMAWGTGPVDPESAWAAYRQLEKQLVLSNVGSKAYYGAEVAAVLARSQAVPRDSVHAVLARVRGDALTAAEGYPPVREELLGLQAAVLYRLGDSSRADEMVAQFQRRDPARANRWAGRRMLRDFVTASGPSGR